MAKIKLTNSVTLDSTSLSMGIDFGNQIATTKGNRSTSGEVFKYTAANDCWMFLSVCGSSETKTQVYVDNIQVYRRVVGYNTGEWNTGMAAQGNFPGLIFLKKGQVIRLNNSDTCATSYGYFVYGCK